MVKNWFPIIDYEKCTKCLSCVRFCPHDVYDEKDGKPVVARPENCVEFCRGCQRGVCNNNAITYFSEEKKEVVK